MSIVDEVVDAAPPFDAALSFVAVVPLYYVWRDT